MNNVNKFLLDYNRQQSDFFLSADEVARRDLYRAHHPTKVMVEKCMDGRINVPAMTDNEVPMGIISPYRNMGGKFRIGSPNFKHYVRNFHEHTLRAMKEGRCPGGLNISTYHFSSGDPHRGCKGFNYDTVAARECTAELTRRFNHVYGRTHQVVHGIQMGVETDLEAFIFHGDVAGSKLDITETLELSEKELWARMRALYPEMKGPIFNDLMRFAVGNQRHVRKVREANRPVEKLDHGEDIIAVGRGFDWLHLINKALIVGPFSVGWLSEVVVAANIVLSNFREGRIPREGGAVLLVSSPYREYGVDAAIAKENAIEMAKLSWDAVRTHVPELLTYDLEVVVGTLDRNTMKFERIEEQLEFANAA